MLGSADPSLFPFFVLSSLLISTGLAGLCAWPLEGLMRPLWGRRRGCYGFQPGSHRRLSCGGPDHCTVGGAPGVYPGGGQPAGPVLQQLWPRLLCGGGRRRGVRGEGSGVSAVGRQFRGGPPPGGLGCGGCAGPPGAKGALVGATCALAPGGGISGLCPGRVFLHAGGLCLRDPFLCPHGPGGQLWPAPLLRRYPLRAAAGRTRPGPVPELFVGLMELSTGTASLGEAAGSSAALPLAAFILGWGGLSVHCQSLPFWRTAGVKAGPYLGAKFAQGILSAGLTALALWWFPLSLPVMAPRLTLVSPCLLGRELFGPLGGGRRVFFSAPPKKSGKDKKKERL